MDASELEKFVVETFEDEMKIDVIEMSETKLRVILCGRFVERWDSEEYVYKLKEIIEDRTKKEWKAKVLESIEEGDSKFFYVELEA
ncbi:MAG: hypothetical protein J7K98_03985 [Candidatus Aenigmarchaeota archaeon]|nr:hypothetical protein [Candidatus Aenigmarchaeota archaeon]